MAILLALLVSAPVLADAGDSDPAPSATPTGIRFAPAGVEWTKVLTGADFNTADVQWTETGFRLRGVEWTLIAD